MKTTSRSLARFTLGSITAALLGCAAVARAAEEPNYLDLSLAELMNIEVFTPSKKLQTLRDSPGTTVVVTAEQIRNRGYRNLVDLLEMLPGFDVQRRSDSGRYNDVTMRGNFKHRQFLILQDGVQIDAPTDDILVIADNYPLYHAKQVEVVYGPNSALWGTDAFGGVINIITKRGSELDRASLSVAAGSDGYRYDRFLAGKGFDNGWSVTVGGHRHHSDTPDLSESYPDQFGRQDAVSFGGAVIVPATEHQPYNAREESGTLFARADYGKEFTMGLQHSRTRTPSSTGADPSYDLYSPDAKMVADQTTLYASYDHDWTDALHSKTVVDYSLRELQPESRFNNAYTDFLDAYKYAKEERYGIEQQFNYEITKEHTLTAGLVHQQFYSIVRPADTDDRYDPDKPPHEQELYYYNIDLPIEIFDLTYSNSGAYAQLQSDWNEEWSTTLGMRFDHNSEFGNTWNPRLGLVFQPNERDTWKLLYGEAFRTPSPTEAMLVYGSFTDETNANGEYISYWMAAPNLDLGPEKLRSLELNFSHSWEMGALSISGYYSHVEDIINTIQSPEPVQFVPGGEILATSITVNQGEAAYYGIDTTIDHRFILGEGLSADLWGSYSYIDGEYKSSPQASAVDSNYIANHKLRLGLTLNVQDRWFITPKLRINSPTNTNRIDPTDRSKRITSPGFGVMDLTISARDLFDIKGLHGQFDVNNLFDRRYYNAGGQGYPVYYDGKAQPQRSWWATLEYDFNL